MKYLCDNCSPKIGCTNRFENKKTECDSYVPMNNEQFIRFCDTEQLAECISDITCNCWGCKRIYVEDCPNYAKYKACFCDKEDVVEWLKQPHTNE